jgi:nucleoside-diphosphate-sugar epimerase
VSRVVVTGGSGFIGANLVPSLVREGHEVVNHDLVPPSDRDMRRLWRPVDIRDESAVLAAFVDARPEVVFHLAARTDLNGRSIDDYAANTTGVTNVIRAAGRCDTLRRIIFASSRLVCRIGYQPTSAQDFQPTTAYGESKVRGEQLVYEARDMRATWTIVRPTSIWGPGFKVPYRNFFDAVGSGRYLHPRGVTVRKSFGYVGNTVQQLRRLAEAPTESVHGRMFYLADYDPIEVLEWGNAIARELNGPAVRQAPMSVLRLLARTGDALAAIGWKSVPLTSFRLDNLVTPMVHDLEPLRAVCGPLPATALQGVAATAAWMRAQRRGDM